jgi:uncharacterized alkaline shock family protein YloU
MVEGAERGAQGAVSAPQADTTHAKVDADDLGKTFISDDVVSIIARIAAEQVEGVRQIGESNLRGMFGRLGRSKGIASEVGLKEAAIDVEIVVDYGYPIKELAETLRRQIIENVEYMTGRRVVEVNVHVVDVYVPKTEKRARRQLD